MRRKNLEINDFPVQKTFPVLWGHMDAAQHVNNLVYLKWAESIRICYFEKIGINMSFKGIGPILGWQDCKYIFPVTYPDDVVCGARISEILSDRFMMECAVFSIKYNRL